MKKIMIRDGIIYNEIGVMIGTISADATLEDIRTIELGAALIPVAEAFIDQIDNGALRAKYTYREFKNVFDRFPEIKTA